MVRKENAVEPGGNPARLRVVLVSWIWGYVPCLGFPEPPSGLSSCSVDCITCPRTLPQLRFQRSGPSVCG